MPNRGDHYDDPIIAANGESGEEESDDEPVQKWCLTEASRPLQYVPLCRNSQLLLMKKFAMNHLWTEAADLMTMLLTDARHPPLIVFRYGMLVLQHYAPSDSDSFRQYYQETVSPFVMRFLSRNRREKDKIVRAVLMNVNKKEIILDVSALLFKHRCDEEIVELFDWLRNHMSGRRVRDYDLKHKNRIVETYYNGYETYMRFLQWRRKSKLSSPSHEDDDEEDAIHDFNDQDRATIDHLISVVNSCSNFSVDLFLAALVEMYESKGKYEEAVAVTLSHSAKRGNDLHAHLRHYDMIDKRIDQIKKSSEDNDVSQLDIMRTQSFRQIARISPAHPLVRDVCDSDDPVIDQKGEEAGEEDLTTRIQLLMNFLDYRENMNDETAWQALNALLEDLSQTDKRSFRKFMRHFNSRIADYWESVHFNADHVCRESASLIQSKVAIASMAGVCSKYRNAVRKQSCTV